MTRSKDRPGYRSLLFSLVISGIMLAAGLALVPEIKAHQIIGRLLWPLTRLMLLITVGLLVGQIIETTGWTKALAIVARPMFRFGHLGNHCSAAFTAAFFSGVSSNAMLFDFLQEGKITRAQLYLTNFINQLPAFFLHLPTTFFIVIPLTGLAGGLYFLLTFLAVVLRTVFYLVYGHFRLPATEDKKPERLVPTESAKTGKFATVWQRIKLRLPDRVTGIAIFVVPIYILVFVLNAMGMFKLMRNALTGFIVTNFIPMESLSVVVLSFAAEFTSGFAAAGALMQAGVLTVKQTVVALLIGNIVAFPVRALRHQLPRYVGIFSPKMGAQILIMGQGFRVLSLIIVGLIYFFIF